MASNSRIEQFDQAVEQILHVADARLLKAGPALDALVRVASELRDLPRESFKARLKSDLAKEAEMAQLAERHQTPEVSPVPKGYRTVTPYIVAQDAPGLIDFVSKAFGGEQLVRSIGGAGGVHAEVRVDDCMLMIGGGGEGLAWRGESKPGAFHIYVPDCDEVYARALDAGAKSISEPQDQPYGERSGGVVDAEGNYWYIATHQGGNYVPPDVTAIMPYLHPLKADPVLAFLKDAFAAEILGRFATPDGVVRHAIARIGTSYLEMGEAHGPYQPMHSMFYLYVPDCDAMYEKALDAGATSIYPPADHDYGDRGCGVRDSFGNEWYIATHIRDVTP